MSDDEFDFDEPSDMESLEDLAQDAIERAALDFSDDQDMELEVEIEIEDLDQADNEQAQQQDHDSSTSSSSAPFSIPSFLFSSGRAVSLLDVMQLLQSGAVTTQASSGFAPRSSRRRAPVQTPPNVLPQVKEPQEAGVGLLLGGEFGSVRRKIQRTQGRRYPRNFIRSLREVHSSWRASSKEQISSDVVPNSSGTVVASYRMNAYCGQYSKDSSFYYTCCRDFRLHVYDTTEPIYRRDPSKYIDHLTTMKLIKTIKASPDSWTITDSHLSPDNERMIWASVTPTVYMTSTTGPDTSKIPISFADRGGRDGGGIWGGFGYHDHCSIWSCRFSADGNEIVAGGDGQIFVYDLLADRRTVKIEAHEDDVNSCCWADTSSGNILISASDDTFLKVWDRRSLGSNPKPSGVLIGHTEGITYVSPKGDGRYLISNGKDQILRLWDLRKMRSDLEYESVRRQHYGIRNFDYRQHYYPTPRFTAHPKDCSVMKYHGHAVLGTLIRCHFSPLESTGQQYIYSGSADGRIHIWSLDGRVVEILDRKKTLPISYNPSDSDPGQELPERSESVCVRDVSWHTQEPVLMSAGWDSYQGHGGSTIAKHEWKGLMKRGGRIELGALEDYVEKREAEMAESPSTRVPGSFRH